MARRYTPERGDILFIDLSPTAGHEQAGSRPALVLSPERFNRKVGMALVAPITSRIRGHGFEVPLVGTGTAGVALCHQIKTVDYRARKARLIEAAPDEVVQDALARLRALLA